MALKLLLCMVIGVVIWMLIMTILYGNPYKLIMVFGRKGSGKTTLLVRWAIEHKQKGWTVYSTCPVPGCYLIEAKDLGYFEFEEHSVIFIDEASLYWDNRAFKSFDPKIGEWFRLQRQRKIKVYLFSQTFDVDLKIRNLCDSMYMCFNFGGWLSYAKEIKRKLVIVQPSEDSESRIADTLVISPFFLAIFGARVVTYIPKWIPYFDTAYMAKEKPLQKKVWPKVDEIYLATRKQKWYQLQWKIRRWIRRRLSSIQWLIRFRLKQLRMSWKIFVTERNIYQWII